jgi:hypothetical protein
MAKYQLNLPGLIMKKIAWLGIILSVAAPGSAQAPCADPMTINGAWIKNNDALMASTNQSKVIAHIDGIADLFKTAYSAPKGIEAHWYRSMGGHLIINNGPQPYQYNSLYQSWYCNKTANKLELNEETGTWAYAFVNGFGWFISDQYDLLLIKVNNQNVYFLPPVKDQWKGYNVYQASSHGDMGRCIILLHNDQLPWKPITQQQYLQAVRSYWESSKRGQDTAYDAHEASIRRNIINIQNNKYLKQEDRDKIIAGLQKDLEEQPKKKADGLAFSNKYWGEKFKVIDDYVAQHSSLLQEPAIMEPRFSSDFNGSFASLERGGQMLVTIDPSYFNKQLPAFAAQLIVLYWRWDKNPASMNFKKEFEENFPVDKLKTMLDK